MRANALQLFVAASALLAAALPAGAAPDIGAAYPRILNCYAAGLHKGAPEAEVRRVAQYDLLCGGVDLNADAEIAHVRQLNPHILILPYVILREYRAGSPEIAKAWWAKDTHGRKFAFWPGTHVLNLLLPEVQDWLVAGCEKILADPAKFDGIFFDGYDRSIDYLNHDQPGDIDLDGDGKRDDRATRDAKWRAAEESVIRRVGALRGGKVTLMANTWAFPEWVPKRLLHGVLAEDQVGRIRHGQLSLEQFLEGYRATATASRTPAVIGVVNGGSDLDIREYLALSREQQAAEQEKVRANAQAMRFGLCATLMGDGYYGYDLGPHRGQHWWYAEYAKIGYPTGPAQRMPAGLWMRRFRDGDGVETTVVVNGAKRPGLREWGADSAPGFGNGLKRVTIPSLDGAILKHDRAQ